MKFGLRRHQKLPFGNHPLPLESLQMLQEREALRSGIYIHGWHLPSAERIFRRFGGETSRSMPCDRQTGGNCARKQASRHPTFEKITVNILIYKYL